MSIGIICVSLPGIDLNKLFKKKINKNTQDVRKSYDARYTQEVICAKNGAMSNKASQIKFLIIQRKHSYSYVEFIRGLYNNKNLTIMFDYMSNDEKELIRTKTFEQLWDEFWIVKQNHKQFQKEYYKSKIKYEELKNKSSFIKFAQSDGCEDKIIKYILFSPILNMCTFINSSFIHKKLFEENEIIKKTEEYKKTYYIYLISFFLYDIPNIIISGLLLQKYDKKLDFVTLTFIAKSFLTIILSSLSFLKKIGWIKFNKN